MHQNKYIVNLCLCAFLPIGLVFVACQPRVMIPENRQLKESFECNQHKFCESLNLLREHQVTCAIVGNGHYESSGVMSDDDVDRLFVLLKYLSIDSVYLNDINDYKFLTFNTDVSSAKDGYYVSWGYDYVLGPKALDPEFVYDDIESAPYNGDTRYVHEPLGGNWYIYRSIVRQGEVIEVDK